MAINHKVSLLKQKIQLQHKIADKKSEESLVGFLDNIIINSAPEPRLFRNLMTEEQREKVYKPLIPALENVAGFNRKKGPDAQYKGPQGFFLVQPKGSDKSGTQGRCISWLLGYSKRPTPLKIYSGAADLEQAQIILDSMSTECLLNPWLKKRLAFNKKECIGPGGKLQCLTSDAASIAGILPDVIVLDEITRHKSEKLYTELLAASVKRANCLIIIITNAGIQGSWAWDALQNAKAKPWAWYVYEAPPGLRPPWIDEERVKDQRSSMPIDEGQRLFDNIWTEEGADTYVTRSAVSACEELGITAKLQYCLAGISTIKYYVGIDYGSGAPKPNGTTKDRTALCILHWDTKKQCIIVDRLDVMVGNKDDVVKIADIEKWMDEVNNKFFNPVFICDPYQLEGTIQKFLVNNTMDIRKFEFRGGKKNYEMAEMLRILIVNKMILWYSEAGYLLLSTGKKHTLIDEFAELIKKTTSYGYRFDHLSGGHDDRVCAIGMAALQAMHDRYSDFSGEDAKQDNKPKKPDNPVNYLLGLQHAAKESSLLGL